MSSLTIAEAQWNLIYAFLKTRPGLYVGDEARTRRFVEAVLWITRSGAQWRLVPRTYGPWNSIYKRFARWEVRGVWAGLFHSVSQTPDLEWLLLDSTTIRAHPCAAGALKKTVGKPHKRSVAVAAVLARKFTS
jgi:transposase